MMFLSVIRDEGRGQEGPSGRNSMCKGPEVGGERTLLRPVWLGPRG